MEDCQAGIRINSEFARIYKRLFKGQLGLGKINEAREALERAVELDPNDQTNGKDKELMSTITY